MSHDFDEDNAIGVRGEDIFKRYCVRNGISVLDVSGDPDWQKRDVDFLVRGDDGIEYAYEVKNDTRIWQTRNVFFEDVSNVGFGTVGCFSKTRADYVVICSEGEGKMYIVDAGALRRFVSVNSGKLRRVSVVPGSNSSGLLVPLSDIKSIVKEIVY